MKPDSSFDERYKRLLWLRELGYQVGSGHIVGLPGQTPEIIADDILLFDELDLDMIGIGPFIPHKDTPLANSAPGEQEMTLKTLALTRIVTGNAHMPATTALGSIDPEGRQKGLRVGANVIMPNMTPARFRKLYEIYPNKVCVEENPM
ncbi:MAG: [FeFe] hydrogenase H-cluster radical SAM maturase HydE, partial [Deltaproteobacteria bacterium]|nr:[FeFe] hydrogenase H-cluster radical SAM maturase HydE [Deltaproteobacteria bacterium]